MESKVSEVESTLTLAKRTNVKTVLKEIIHMFPNPERAYPELVQNALDAETPQIDINIRYDEDGKEKDKALITIEDYGIGMDEYDREQFFLKLFASSKENDHRKRGKFGIGLVSVFLLGLEEMLVESTRNSSNGTGWRARIFEIPEENYKLQLYNRNGKEKGTKITLIKKLEKEDFPDFVAKAENFINKYCKYAITPIYFQGKLINQPFDIPSKIKVKFREEDIEGVVALSSAPHYELLGGRLLLKEGERFIEDEKTWSVLVNSGYLSHNISRNDVIKDNHYTKVIDLVEKQKLKLVEPLFKRLEELAQKSPKNATYKELDEEEDLWEWAIDYIDSVKSKIKNKVRTLRFAPIKESFKVYRKKTLETMIPKSVLNSKIFRKVDGGQASLEELLKQIKEDKEICCSTRLDRISKSLSENKKIVVLRPGSYQCLFMKRIGDLKDVDESLYMPGCKADKDLTERETKFLNLVKEGIEGTSLKKHFYTAYIGDYSKEIVHIRSKPFHRPYYQFLNNFSEGQVIKGPRLWWRTILYDLQIREGREELIINTAHPEIEKLMKIAAVNDFVGNGFPAQLLTLQFIDQYLLEGKYNYKIFKQLMRKYR